MREAHHQRCKAPWCKAIVRTSVFACREHWFMLPIELREEISRCLRDRRGSADRLVAATRAASAWYITHDLVKPGPATQRELDEMARTRHVAYAGAGRLPAGSI